MHSPALALAAAPGRQTQGTGYEAPSAWDASIRALSRAVRAADDGSHHPLLVALRELRDPTLKPLFQSLVQGEHWTIQIDGILGLAELDPKQVVDPFHLAQLKGETDRSTAIAAAIGLGMVDLEQAQAMLAWDDLLPRDRVLLMAEVHRRKGPLDAARLPSLAEHRNDEVAGVASILLASLENGRDDAPLEAFAKRFGALPTKERGSVLISLAATAQRFGLVRAVPFLVGQIQDAALPTDARTAAIASALSLDPDAGHRAWKDAVERDAGHANRVRMALVALSIGLEAPGADGAKGAGPAEPLRVLPQGDNATTPSIDPLLATLADAIDAAAGVGDATVVLPRLVATRHRASLVALLDALRSDPLSHRPVPTVPAEARVAAYRAFADLLRTDARRQISGGIIDLAVEAVKQLGTLDPKAVATLLADDREDEVFRDLVFLALAGTNTKEAAETAWAARSRGSRRGASIALILHARFSERLEQSELDELGLIAAGGWRLDPTLEVQAAWLYVRHSGRADEATAALLRP
jgi:hypothetical protein